MVRWGVRPMSTYYHSFVIDTEVIDGVVSTDQTTQVVERTNPTFLSDTYKASENIGGHTVVIMASGGVAKASSSTPNHSSKVIGMTYHAVSSGQNVKVVTSGRVVEPTWSWITGSPIFLSTNGTLTQTPPSLGFILQVGVAVSPTTINIALKQPLILA